MLGCQSSPPNLPCEKPLVKLYFAWHASDRVTPPQLVHAAHGSPPVDGCAAASGLCYVCCGPIVRGKSVPDWLSTNFTDQNRCRSPASTHVCEACCYVQSRTSPVLGREAKEGKKFGGNFRNYSHFYEAGTGYANASKGEKPLIRDFLARSHAGPWFCAIADSGQKHVLPFAPMNGPGGRSGTVLLEEALVSVPEDQSLISDMIALLSAGVTKGEIESGEWYVRTMIENRDAARAFESRHGAHRGSGWFRLAIWLAQRDEEEFAAVDAARKEQQNVRRAAKKAPRNGSGRDGAGDKRRLPHDRKRKAGAELLGADSAASESGCAPVNDGERVGGRGAKEDANPVSAQGRLPGFD